MEIIILYLIIFFNIIYRIFSGKIFFSNNLTSMFCCLCYISKIMWYPCKKLHMFLFQVFELTAHLVYWAKATVIFPICSTNKYVISPDVRLHRNSPLMDKFTEAFPGHNLLSVISDYSLPTSLGQKCNPLFHPSKQSHLVQTIIWMLQHHLLLQLHTYVQYIPLDNMMKPSK